MGDDLVLKQSASSPYKGSDELSRENKGAYFNLISELVQTREFDNDVDKMIMGWHAEGKKIKDICKYLEWLGDSRARTTVRFTIRKYEMQWKIRIYTDKQLNKKTG